MIKDPEVAWNIIYDYLWVACVTSLSQEVGYSVATETNKLLAELYSEDD